MTYFEQCLAAGPWLTPKERQALYAYLLDDKRRTYQEYARLLLERNNFSNQIANGEIRYLINQNSATYEIRKFGDANYSTVIRELKLPRIKAIRIAKLIRLFAQAEVETIANFPVLDNFEHELNSINFNKYPFYDLNYYSKGKGRFLGFVKKLQTRDAETLAKLRTL